MTREIKPRRASSLDADLRSFPERRKRSSASSIYSNVSEQSRLSQLRKAQAPIVPQAPGGPLPLHLFLICPTGHIVPESAHVSSQRPFSRSSIPPLTSSSILYPLFPNSSLNCIRFFGRRGKKEGRREIGRKTTYVNIE